MGSSLMKLGLLNFILFLILFVKRIVTLITHIKQVHKFIYNHKLSTYINSVYLQHSPTLDSWTDTRHRDLNFFDRKLRY